jgi:hypothetical protein
MHMVPQVLAHITSPEREWHRSILCCYWLQYHLHRQLKQVRTGKRLCAFKGVCHRVCSLWALALGTVLVDTLYAHSTRTELTVGHCS